MENIYKYILIGSLAVLFFAKKIFASHPIVKKYNPYISLALIFALAVLLAAEFYKTNVYIGIFAIGLAILATVKVFVDLRKKDK